jgi:hypothetical protein
VPLPASSADPVLSGEKLQQHATHRFVIAVKRRRIEAPVGFSTATVLAEFSDIFGQPLRSQRALPGICWFNQSGGQRKAPMNQKRGFDPTPDIVRR